MTSWLYRSEARGIQGWILGDGRLRGLTGGSQRIVGLQNAIRNHAQNVGEATVLSASAGGAVVRLENAAALERFASTWPAIVGSSEHCPGLELVHAWVPEEEGISELFQAAARARVPRAVTLPVATPITERSGRTGRAAVGRAHRVLVDEASLVRQQDGPRDTLLEELRSAMGPSGNGISFVDADIDNLAGDFPVAIVHSDGDGIGQWMVKNSVSWRNDPSAFQRFSEQLADATRSAAGRAVSGIVGQLKWSMKDALPIRPVVLGGDDLTLICQAPMAMELARSFMAAFAEETQARGMNDGKGFTASTGIAYVPAHFPFHRAHDLAETLCRWAKSRSKAQGGAHLAFHRLTNSLIEEHWQDVLDGELTDAGGRRLTAGPYSLDALEKLDTLRAALNRVSRGPLRKWLGHCMEDADRADREWRRLAEVGRTADRELWSQFEAALQAMGTDVGTGFAAGAPPESPIGDALELTVVSTVRKARSQVGGEG